MGKQVTFIRMREGEHQAHKRIADFGGSDWRLSEEEAIAALKADMNAFYLETDEGTAYLVVRIDDGREYLTTEADGIVPASLLALPECP